MRKIEQGHKFSCQSCGANTYFDFDHLCLVCGHCGGVEEIAATDAEIAAAPKYHSFDNHFPSHVMGKRLVMHCESCGADVRFDGYEHSKPCPFCFSAMVLSEQQVVYIEPDGIMPFAIDKKTARAKIRERFARNIFLSRRFLKTMRLPDAITKIYLPFWIYYSDCLCEYKGKRGTHLGKQLYFWRKANGRVRLNNEYVLVPAGDDILSARVKGMQQWDWMELMAYRPEYVAGVDSETCQLPLEYGWKAAQDEFSARVHEAVLVDIGGDRQEVVHAFMDYENKAYQQILLPFYIQNVRFGGDIYSIIIDGQSGQVSGKLPHSPIRETVFALLCLMAMVLALFAYDLFVDGALALRDFLR